MSSVEQYNSQNDDISRRAEEMRKALFYPILNDGGRFIGERDHCNRAIESAIAGSVFEAAGKSAGYIAGTSANALRDYCSIYGRIPSDDLLAAAHRAAENMLTMAGGASVGNLVLESATLNTTDGIQFRDRMVALILPVMLNCISSQMVGFVPGDYNRSEIFRLYRTAGTTFGDITAGDRIDQSYGGQYGCMDQRYLAGTGDGTKTGSSHEFRIDSNAKFGKVYPFKKKTIQVFYDRNPVGADDGNGNLAGVFKVGSTTINVTGSVNYATGTADPVFSVAPPNGIEVHIGWDIDIEKAPSLIPTVNHELDNRVLIPHESAIAADTTLQALWYARRELNMNLDSMAMMTMRNLLAASKDRKALAEMRWFAKGEYSWTYTLPSTGISPSDYYDTLLPVLLQINSEMLVNTQTSGLIGIVADSVSATKFMGGTREGQFKVAPNYQFVPQPHYAGRMFDMFDLFIDPQAPDFTNICYGKGPQISHCGYMAGDAVPAMAFKHAIQGDLKYNNTLWELSYRDLQPFDGREYLTILKLKS